MKGFGQALPAIAFGALLLLAWQGAVWAFAIKPYVLPGPGAVGAALVGHFSQLLPAALVTFGLAMQALAIAAILGLAAAVMLHRAPILERAAGPYMLILQTMPVVAIAPLVVIWAGVEEPRRAILILAVIVAVFPIFANALAGLKAVDAGHKRLFQLYRASGWARFVRLELPTATPFLLAGAKTAGGLALVGVVVAEFVAGTGRTGGLAWRILEAGNRLQTDVMFAALGLLCGLALLVFGALSALERLALAWREG